MTFYTMKVEDHNINKERILKKISETNHKSQTRSELASTDDGIKYVPITDRESFISNSDWGHQARHTDGGVRCSRLLFYRQ